MEFFKVIDKLKTMYADDCVVRKNGTILLHPGEIPNCRHMLFRPLTQDIVEEYLAAAYKNPLPPEYISFLQYTNGANLVTVRVKTQRNAFAHSLFTIYGLPRRPPYSRPDGEEPFDVRIEDLARHKDIPQSWLKCGQYIQNFDFHVNVDIFIDTFDGQVYACEKNRCEIKDQWKNLDVCFCGVYESLKEAKDEYLYCRK